jgi:hypothetical protein
MIRGGEAQLIAGLKELTLDHRARFMLLYAKHVTAGLKAERYRRQERDQKRRPSKQENDHEQDNQAPAPQRR